MECNLNKQKIKDGIIETAKDMISKSGLFTIDGNKLSAINPTTLEEPEMTDSQRDMLDDANNYANSITSDIFRDMFLENPAEFLREIARQANSTEAEAAGALDVAGYKLFQLALQIFPDEGKVTAEGELIRNINKDFRDEVIRKTGVNEWTIHPSDDLAMQYLMAQSGSSQAIIDDLRSRYLAEFSSTSLNLLADDLWLNHPFLQDPSIQDLLKFAKKINPAFKVIVTDNIDANAVSLIRDNIIFIRQGSIISELPEEIAHFFFELLPDDNEIKKEMMDKITSMKIYSETFQKYKNNPAYQKNGYPDIEKIKREASAKLIGEYIKAAYRNEADEKYGNKRSWLKDIVRRFFKWLRKAFVTNSASIYTEPLFDINSPFKKAANSITKGDITSLNLSKVPSIYDSIFFSQIEDSLEEGFEASNIAKSLYEFSRTLKGQVTKTFFKYAEKENMKGIMELLQDPTNKDYNRIWDIVNKLTDVINNLKDARDEGAMLDQLTLARATSMLAESYREMEDIPIAIEKVLSKMSKDKTETQLLDNINELQTYFQFSDTFKNITDEFVKLLKYIRTTYPEQTEGANGIYEMMIEKMGSTELRFKGVDGLIMSKLQNHIIELTHKWTDAAFSKYRGEINQLHSELESVRLKNEVAKLITDKITGIEQIRQAVTGKFPSAKKLTLADGTKVDLSKVKDMSQIDYVIFMFASPTLISDPFISNMMAYFTDRYTIALIKGEREAKQYADKILPLKKELADMGVDWYQAEEAIQNVQSFYDYSLEDNKTEKRTLLSATNRFDFQYQKQLKIKEIDSIVKEIDTLQGEFKDAEQTRKDELKPLITNKQTELKEKRTDFDKWMNDWSYRPYTPEFYEKQAKLRESRSDSPALKKWKELSKKILQLEEKQAVAIASERTINEPLFDSISEELANLQYEKLKIQDQLPEIDKEMAKLYEELFEVDEVASSRVRQYHKNQWIESYVIARGEVDTHLTKMQLQQLAEENYTFLHSVVVPNEEFYKIRNDIFARITASTKDVPGLEKLSARMEELRLKESRIIKPFRDSMRGEVNVNSMKFISLENDINGEPKMLSESLKDIELEIDSIRQKLDLYRVVLSTPNISDNQKNTILALIDMVVNFSNVIDNRLVYKPEHIKDVFKGYIELTTSQAEQILSAINKAALGDNLELNALATLDLTNTTPFVKAIYSQINFNSLDEMKDSEKDIYAGFKFATRQQRAEMRSELDGLFAQLNDLYTNSVSLPYYTAMKQFFMYAVEYAKNTEYDYPGKDLHITKINALLSNPSMLVSIADIENMMADGLFEGVIGYIKWKELNEIDPNSTYSLSELMHFFVSIHKPKTIYLDGDAVTTWTPVSYLRRPITDPSLTEVRYPRFLTRNRIKDKYRTEKVYETDPEVIAGNKTANVDINGEWLPLEREDSPFWNKEYAALKNATDAVGKKKFEFLEKTKQEYLKMQQEYLPEGERLDLVLPSKYVDKMEQKQLFINNVKEGWNYIRNVLPFGQDKGLEEENQNYLEDIKAVGIQNRDIYTGAVINEKHAKMRSRRRIPLNRTTKDATSSIAMFIEDVNEYSGKTLAAPVMKSFADVFTAAHQINPSANKYRSSTLQDIYDTKILGEVPDNMANNPNLAKFLSVVNTLTTFRLLGDPIGALINYTSGTLQQVIDANWTKEEYNMYMKSGWIAKDWLYEYDKDFWKKSSWGLETQLIGIFNMIPDRLEISHQLSQTALYASIRSKLMAPRSESEKLLAIHLGLSIALTEKIPFEDKLLTIRDIYHVDEVTNLVELKPEYKTLEKEWNPIDGTKVLMLRRKIIQKYTLLQGNFFRQNQSFASTTALGKTAEIMKRWFASGVIRRFQGERVDPFTGETTKGYHLAMGHALRALFRGAKHGDGKYVSEYFGKFMRRRGEQLAIRRSISEMLATLIFGLMATYILGYDDDDDDKNKKLREASYLKQLALLITLRVQSELGTFIPLPVFGLGYMEMKRAVLDPVGLPKASLDNISGIAALMVMQILSSLGLNYDDRLTYQKGKPYNYHFGGLGAFKDKGDSKLWAIMLNTIGYTGYTFEPAEYIKTLTQMQNRIK